MRFCPANPRFLAWTLLQSCLLVVSATGASVLDLEIGDPERSG